MAVIENGLTLAEQADLLTNPSLQGVVLKTIKDRGAREFAAMMPTKSFVGRTYDWLEEAEIGTGNSAQDPYGENNIPETGGRNRRLQTSIVQLVRHALTPKIDIISKSDYVNKRMDDLEKQAKKLARDVFQQSINGFAADPGHAGFGLHGLEYYHSKVFSAESDFRVWATDDGTPSGTKESLALSHILDLISRHKYEPYDVLFMDRETWIAFHVLLQNAGGNTAAMQMMEAFGQSFYHYQGVPIVVNDAIGMDKEIGAATVSGDGNTVTVTDVGFLGAGRLQVGQTITLSDGTNTETAVVEAVTDTHTMTIAASGRSGGWDTNIGGSTGLTGRVESENVIYAVRFDATDGVCMIYAENMGMPANPGEYYGPVAGFDVEDMGLERNSPRYKFRLDLYGQIVQHQAENVASLAGFTL